MLGRPGHRSTPVVACHQPPKSGTCPFVGAVFPISDLEARNSFILSPSLILSSPRCPSSCSVVRRLYIRSCHRCGRLIHLVRHSHRSLHICTNPCRLSCSLSVRFSLRNSYSTILPRDLENPIHLPIDIFYQTYPINTTTRPPRHLTTYSILRLRS